MEFFNSFGIMAASPMIRPRGRENWFLQEDFQEKQEQLSPGSWPARHLQQSSAFCNPGFLILQGYRAAGIGPKFTRAMLPSIWLNSPDEKGD